MKKLLISIILLFSILILFSDGLYMNSAFNTGSNALFYNPAFLGRDDVPYSSVDFYRINLGFTNDLISPRFTEYLFPNSGVKDLDYISSDTIITPTMNDTLTDEKKRTILHNIGEYFHFAQYCQVAISPIVPLNFKINGFAFGQKAFVGELTQIPGDFFELLMYGNYFDSIYDFSSLQLNSQAYAAIAAGLGAKIPLENGMSVNFGLSGAYIASYSYFNLSMDSMAFESDAGYLRQIAYGKIAYGLPFEMHLDSMVFNDSYRTSFSPTVDKDNLLPPPGNGFDLNIGLALNLTDEFLVELSYNHAISRVYWNNGGKEYAFALKTDSLNLSNIYGDYAGISEDSTLSEDDIIEALLDSLLYYDITSTLDQDEQLITILEPEINLGFLYHMKYLPLNAFIRYTQGFKNTAFSSIYPKFTTGIQYTMWNWLLLESAAAFGGREGFQFNIGLGIKTDRYTSDINMTQDRGLIYDNKGLHLSVNAGINSSTYGVFTGTVIDSATKLPLIANLKIRRNNANGIDEITTDSLGYFMKKYKNTKLSVMITAENYDTIIDSMDILQRDRIERLYKLKSSGGILMVKVIDGVNKNIMTNAIVIFTDDTLYTDALGTVSKRMEEGENVIIVKAENKEDNVFTVEIEKGKNYEQLVEMMPLYGKFRLHTYNISTNEPVSSMIKILTTDMKTIIDSFHTDSKGLGDSKAVKKGNYNIHITPLVKKYIEQDKFNIQVKGGYVKKVDVGLLKEKMVFVFNNILFDFNKASLRPESYPVLDSLLTILRENPTIKVEIGGHTDTRGSSSYNRKLSQSRAESVRTYLIKKGISSKRIIAYGYGEDLPLIIPEKTDMDYQKNRRVEFKILESK